jgi:hypothetical protein
MDERRKSPRLRCRVPCEIVHASGSGKGTLIDFSEGGLCVHSDLEIEQGETLRVAFVLPRAGALEIEALAWHARRVRDRAGRQFCALGLMIASAPEAYLALVPKAAPTTPRKNGPEAAVPGAGAGAGTAELQPFRIRLKALGGPRTRTLCVSAASTDEARALAVANLGAEWEVLEVQGG